MKVMVICMCRCPGAGSGAAVDTVLAPDGSSWGQRLHRRARSGTAAKVVAPWGTAWGREGEHHMARSGEENSVRSGPEDTQGRGEGGQRCPRCSSRGSAAHRDT